MKTFDLIKELLKVEKCGANTALYHSIDLAIQIHCAQNQIDEKDFKNKLKLIEQACWNNSYEWQNNKNKWTENFNRYMQLIETMR